MEYMKVNPVINRRHCGSGDLLFNTHNSRVLLLTDTKQCDSSWVIRNDIRVVASGMLERTSMAIRQEHIPTSADIIQEEESAYMTSWFGWELYPEVYPWLYVSAVDFDPKREFAVIKAEPVVEFDKLRYLLLVWLVKENKTDASGTIQHEQALLGSEDGQ